MADFALSAEIDLRTRNLSQVIRQIQTGIGGVKGDINVGVSRSTQTSIDRINKGLSTTTRTFKTTSTAARDAADSVGYFGKQSALAIRRFAAFTIVTTGFINFSKSVKQSITEAIDFQRELIKISQVTGRTVKGLSSLNNEITRLATSLGTSSSNLLQASRTLSQTGLAAREVEKSLAAIAKSDLSPTFDSITDTTEGSVALFRQFNVSAEQLEGKLSSINSVSKKFAIESGDVITAVRRSGGAFAAAGGQFEEFIALLTSVRSTTRESAESIATGFRTIFTRLQRTRTQNFLGQLGIDLRNAEGQFVGPYEAIRKLSVALKDLKGTDPRFAQIIEELGGFRQVTKVIPLIQQFGVSQKALAVAQKENNSLTQDAETAQEALAVKIQKVREEFEALIRTIADSESFKGITDAILLMAKAAISLSDALVPLLPALTILGTVASVKLGKRFFAGDPGFLSTFSGSALKRNSGGGVPGFGNSDTVPAMLTPGEFVLNKKAVSKLGEKNLTKFNNGARFQTGGTAGKVISSLGSAGTNTKTIAGGLILQMAVSHFSELSDETKKLISNFTGLAVQFALVSSAVKNSVDATKRNTEIQNTQSKIEKAVELKGRTSSKIESLSKDRFSLQGERFDREASLKSRTISEKQSVKSIVNELAGRDADLSSRRSGLENRLTSLQPKSGGIDLPSTSAERKKIEQEIEEISQQQYILEKDKGKAQSQNNKLISQRKVEQGQINNLKSQEAGLSRKIESAEKGVALAEQSRLANQKKLEASQKSARRAQIIGQSIGAGSLLAGAVGQTLSSFGSKNIQEGGESSTLSSVGGALSGAASGAAIGAIFGPIGAGVGAVGGVLFGFATSLSEAKSQIEQVQLAKTVENVRLTLESVERGGLTAGQSAFGLTSRLQDIRSRQLRNAGDPEAAKNIQSEINNISPGLTVFLTKLAQGSNTFDEFNKQAEGILSFFSRQQNIPIEELKKTYDDQIKQQNRSKQINEEGLRQFEIETQRLREINVISIAVANSFRQLEKVQNDLATQTSSLSNTIQTGGFKNTAAGFSQLSTVGDIAGFEQDARNIGQLFGDAGQRIASELVAGAQVSQRLPDILNRLKEQDPLGQGGEFVSKLESELADVPSFIRNAIISQAKGIVGDEGKDVTIISEIRKDVLGVAKKLVSTIEESLGRPLEEAGQELANRKNAFTEGIASIQQAIDAANQRRFQSVDIGQQLLQTRLQRPLTEGEANQEFIKKLDIIAGNGPKTVDGIVKALGPARERLASARENFSNLAVGNNVNDLQNNFKNTNEEVIRLNNSLKFLADSTILVSNAQKELTDAGQQQAVERGFLETLLAGTPEEQQLLAKQINALNILIALQKENNLKNTPKNILQSALPLLKANPTASFQGVQFDKLLENTLKALTPAGLEGFGQEGDKAESARERLITALEEQKKANDVLAADYRNTGNKIAQALTPLLTKFVADIKAAFLQSEERAASNEKSQAESVLRTAETKKADIQLVSDIFGVTPEEVFQIKAASDELKRFAKISNDIKSLKSLDTVTNKFNGFGEGLTLGQPGLSEDARTKFLEKTASDREKQVKIFDEVLADIGRNLSKQGFSQDQVGDFKDKFEKLAGPELSSVGGLTQKEAQEFFETSVTDIAKKALKSLEKEQKKLKRTLENNSLFDTEAERSAIIKNIELFGEELQRVDEKFVESTVDKYRESLRLIKEKLDKVDRPLPIIPNRPASQQQQVPQQQVPQQQVPQQQVPQQQVPQQQVPQQQVPQQQVPQPPVPQQQVPQQQVPQQQVPQQRRPGIHTIDNDPFENRKLKEIEKTKAIEEKISNRQKKIEYINDIQPLKRDTDANRREGAVQARNESEFLRIRRSDRATEEAKQRLEQNRNDRPEDFDPSNLIANQGKFKEDEAKKRAGTLNRIKEKQEEQTPARLARLEDARALITSQPELKKKSEEDRQKALENTKRRQGVWESGQGSTSGSGTGFFSVPDIIPKKEMKEFQESFDGGTKNIKSASETLLEISKVIPKDINFTGNLKLDVLINGAEVLGQIQPQLAEMVKTQVGDAISKLTNNLKIGVS